MLSDRCLLSIFYDFPLRLILLLVLIMLMSVRYDYYGIRVCVWNRLIKHGFDACKLVTVRKFSYDEDVGC
jgi:hypothetical protein